MRICVLGVGAVGGFLGYRLAAAGYSTSALARGATLDALRARGWQTETRDGDRRTAPVLATADPAELGPQDLVILAVKAHSLPSALSSLRPLLGQYTIVLAALNGVPWWFFDGFGGPYAGLHLDSVDPGGRIAAAVPLRHVLGAVVHFSASTPEPGLVRHQHGTGIIVGEPGGDPTPRLEDLVALLTSAGLDATASTAIHTDVWYKLWGNLTMNPVSVLTGATSDLIIADDLVRRFCEQAMAEAQAVGARIGCPIEQTPQQRIEMTRQLGAARTSMLQDAQAGRRLELAALTGAVSEIGAVVGVPTPAVDAILGLTRLHANVHGLS